jgi:hypothetical protein
MGCGRGKDGLGGLHLAGFRGRCGIELMRSGAGGVVDEVSEWTVVISVAFE